MILLIEGKNFYSFGDGVADFMEDIYEMVRTVLLANAFFSFFHLPILVNMDIFSRRYLKMIFSPLENL